MANDPGFAIIGGGPAGLIAAETLAQQGCAVTIYERKPSFARKFQLAGRGGLNLTHSEPLAQFLQRYGHSQPFVEQAIRAFPPQALRDWAATLGEPTFVGSSGRVFPTSFKATPLLRAWLDRLQKAGVQFCLNHKWLGWNEAGCLLFEHEGTRIEVQPRATLLALGGASWPHLGADGSWMELLQARGVPLAPLQPANCGFAVAWSDLFKQRFAGQPLKNISLNGAGRTHRGEIMICANGVEGGGIYALSAALRDALQQGPVILQLDLAPDLSLSDLTQKLHTPRGSQSFATWMQKYTALSPLATNLLREVNAGVQKLTAPALAQLIKALPLQLTAPFPLHRSISTAGGIQQAGVDHNFMLKALPGTFVAGEMLDWEAPTGGYLLQACFATGVAAAKAMASYGRT